MIISDCVADTREACDRRRTCGVSSFFVFRYRKDEDEQSFHDI